jgi:hypothetical protein
MRKEGEKTKKNIKTNSKKIVGGANLPNRQVGIPSFWGKVYTTPTTTHSRRGKQNEWEK